MLFVDGLSDEEEDAKSDHEHQSPTPSPNLNPDYPAPFQIQAPKPKKKKKKAANSKPNPGNGTVKKVKRKDNRLKVLERIQKEKAEREALLAKQKVLILSLHPQPYDQTQTIEHILIRYRN